MRNFLIHRLSLLLVLSTLAIYGQSYQGGVRGSVADNGGGVVANSKVTLIDEATQVSRSTLTNTSGEYAFNAVEPATYSISAESPGFKKFERKGVIISTQQFLTVDLKLEIGNVTESVMVTEEVPLVESSNASTGQVLDHQKLIDLPNLGRNPFMLARIAQNVIPVGNPSYNRMQDQSGSSSITIAGGPVRGNNYLLDGVPITDIVNRAIIIPTLETVEEIKIQANTYDAEMGRTGGGVFNTLLKSGGNRLHGSALGNFRQTDWLANSFFNNKAGIPKADQPFQNWGGSLGGPVRIPKIYNGSNKTFWWVAGEAYRQTSIQTGAFAVPTAAEANGDFSKSFAPNGALQTIYDPLGPTTPDGKGGILRTPFPGNIIPASRLNPIGLAIARTYPAPQKAAAYYGDTNYTANGSLYDRADQLTGKFDHQMLSNWRASLSYLHYGSREPGANYFNTVSSPEQWLLYRKVDSTQFNNIVTLSPTAVLNVRYGYNRFPNEGRTRSDGYNLLALGFPSSFVNTVQKTEFPNIAFQTLGNGDYRNLSTNNQFYQNYNSKNFLVGFAKFLGRHSLKTGFDFRRINADSVDYGNASGAFSVTDLFTRQSPSQAATGSGADLASLLLGYADSSDSAAQISTKLFQHVDYYAGYLHDDYRISSKLTLNLGVRFEYESGLVADKNALVTGFDTKATSPLAITNPSAGITAVKGGVMYAGQNGYQTHTGAAGFRVAPRFGAAYALNTKTTLRGGYGIFYAPIPYGAINTPGYTQTTPYVGTNDNGFTPATSLSNPFPNGVLQPSGNSLGLAANVGQSITVPDANAKAPLVQQYSFDIQRELPWNIGLVVGYVGSNSRNLVLGAANYNINQLDPQYFALGGSLNDKVANPFYQAGGPGFIGSSTIARSQLLKPFPQYTNVFLSLNDKNHARYDSLVVKAQKRFSKGLTFVSTWTYSRNMDASVGGVANFLNGNGAVQNYYNLDAEYSRSIQDSPHRWANAFTYELPFGRGKAFLGNNKLLDYAVGGWSINAVNVYQTGFPLAIKQSNLNSAYGTGGQRPNATGKDPATSGSLGDRVNGTYLDYTAFSQAPQGTLGNVSRTIPVLGPGMANWDISLFKAISITEALKAQFRAEATNAFNTPLFRGPNTTWSPSGAGFGKITSQANYPRYIQLGVRFFF